MKSSFAMRRIALLAVVLGLVAGPARELSASTFRVTPIRVTFGGRSMSTILTLTNESTEELRFQLSAFGWDQAQGTGEMKLTPTQDITFFPTLLTLKAGESRNVRVGTTVRPTETERTYRIFFEELPPLVKKDESRGSQVRIITKMGIPIFVDPAKRVLNGSLKNATVRGGKVSFDVANGGNVHFSATNVKITGLDEKGQPLFERQREGWYVLAGGARTYEMDLPAESCTALRSLRIETQTDLAEKPENALLKTDVTVPPGTCASGATATR
jgi:fimbrial chaperone protein